jgi:hypothetical protein
VSFKTQTGPKVIVSVDYCSDSQKTMQREWPAY